MIALIASWMGPALRSSDSAEDIWQETLAMAWRDRESHEWRDLATFRAWLRGIARHRLQDSLDHKLAQKRGGGLRIESLSHDGVAERPADSLPPVTATPSREAGRRERARLLLDALDGLPEEYRELIRACLFEELSVLAAAERLGLSESTAYRRFLKGSQLFRQRVAERLGSDDSVPEPRDRRA